jgi:hypothetical protein
MTTKAHAAQDSALVNNSIGDNPIALEYTYDFANFFHPYVGELIEQLNKKSLAGLFDPVFLDGLHADFFENAYKLLPSLEFDVSHSPKEIDVSTGGPYANYNWELLFHFPLTVAVHLSKNQRFAEAQRWFHYIFDPTCNDTSVPPPKRFWKFLAFRNSPGATPIDDQLALLSTPDAELSPRQQQLRQSLLAGYRAIKDSPFHPHVVAQNRVIAYQYNVVMKYLDNLIAWGDSLFRQDTIESINEATQVYVLAANLLGPRPQRIPPRGSVGARSFQQLKASLDQTGNAWVELEGKFPSLLTSASARGRASADAGPLFGIGRTLYFCIPRNDKLLAYWDTVADRLFKIRNCMNIEGIVRQLALFDPPLDPGMLVKAAAAGIDIGSIVSGLNQPPSPLRAPWFIQKALELCAEVRSMGAALLAAIEKRDGEKLALLRQRHEIVIQTMVQEVRFMQWQQAREATASLLRGRAAPLERYAYYQRLLGLEPQANAAAPSLPDERSELTEGNFDETFDALVKQYDKEVGGPAYPKRTFKEEGTLRLLAGEYDDLNGHADRAFGFRSAAAANEAITAGLAALPDIGLDMAYWGIGGKTDVAGGRFLANAGRAVSAGLGFAADQEQWQGQYASKLASYERRADEWALQSNLAARELVHIGRQIIGALIAEQAARNEYQNVGRQIEHAQQVYQAMQEKYTNEELYAWMQGETARLYYEYYRFAFDTARKAETTMKRELMRPELDATDFVKFNYWDGGRKGLLSGEALFLDVKRMEMAYHEHNKREYELVKHVSLLQVDPLALIELRATGKCTVQVPEALFDMDGSGHYFRRIKTVAVSIPCVAGPYASVNCTLALLKSSIRKSSLLGDGYARTGAEDSRFADNYGNIQSIVTSSAQNDSGLFETNLRDERFLPFEGAGVISQWRLELPANPSAGEPQTFDYDTISDVILHIRYTARQGGGQLREHALGAVKELIDEGAAAGSLRMFSLRHEFPTEWARFTAVALDAQTPEASLALTLRQEHYPFWASKVAPIALRGLTLFAEPGDGTKPTITVATAPAGDPARTEHQLNTSLGNLRMGALGEPLPPALGALTLRLDDNSITDLWMVLTWGSQ